MSSLVSALKSKLAGPETYEKLIASDLQQVLAFLRVKYGLVAVLRQAEDENRIHQSIDGKYYDALRRVRSLSPPGLGRLIGLMAQWEELELLATVLKAAGERVDPDTLLSGITPRGEYDEERIRQLAEAGSVRRASEMVLDPDLRETLLTAVSEFGADPASAVDLAIQREYSIRLWRGLRTLLSGQDSETVKHILGQWFDLRTLLLVARSQTLGISAKTIRALMLPAHYRLSGPEIEDMVAASSADLYRRIAASRYGKAMSPTDLVAFPELDASSLEIIFDRYLAQECFQVFAGWRFTAGVAVAFVFLKQFEARDLKAILTGKVRSLPAQSIRRSITLHQKPLQR